MREELGKYSPVEFEKDIFDTWQKNDLFRARVNEDKRQIYQVSCTWVMLWI